PPGAAPPDGAPRSPPRASPLRSPLAEPQRTSGASPPQHPQRQLPRSLGSGPPRRRRHRGGLDRLRLPRRRIAPLARPRSDGRRPRNRPRRPPPDRGPLHHRSRNRRRRPRPHPRLAKTGESPRFFRKLGTVPGLLENRGLS